MKDEASIKDLHTDSTNVDTVLTRRDALIYAVVLTATSGGVADVTIRAGIDSSGKTMLKLKAAADSTKCVMLYAPLRCRNGIFIDVGSNVDLVTVVWAYDVV